MFDIAPPFTTDIKANNILSDKIGGGIGDCLTDRFSVSSGGGAGSPAICGENSGQHSKSIVASF